MSNRNDFEQESDTVTDSETDLNEPNWYKVILLNDDFTPMDFVIDLIMRFFGKNEGEATKIMLNIHHEGQGVCGLFPRDIAETKSMQVNQYSRKHGHPLKCTMEKK